MNCSLVKDAIFSEANEITANSAGHHFINFAFGASSKRAFLWNKIVIYFLQKAVGQFFIMA